MLYHIGKKLVFEVLHVCRLTHKFAKKGRYVSEGENGENMRQILISDEIIGC